METQQFVETREELAEGSINLRHYWHIILERRWLVATSFAMVMVLCLIYLFRATPIYEATTRLQIDREMENALRIESFALEATREQDYLQTQYKNLQSRTLMEAVLRETRQDAKILDAIDQRKRSLSQLSETSALPGEEVQNRLLAMNHAGFFAQAYQGGNAPALAREAGVQQPAGLFVLLSQADKEEMKTNKVDLVKRLSDSVSVSPIRLSRLVDISVESPNRHEAALIANSIIQNFLKQNMSRKEGKLTNALKYLEVEVAGLKGEVAKAYRGMQEFKSENEVLSLEESQNIVLQALKAAQTDYDMAHSRTEAAVAAAGEASRILNEKGNISEVPDVANDAEVKKLHGDLALAESELAELEKRYLEKYPAVIQKKGKIESLKRSIGLSERKVYNAILNKAELAKATEAKLKAVLVERKAEQRRINLLGIQYKEFERAAKNADDMYNLALQRLKETELQKKDTTQNMHVIDVAIPEMKPVKPRKMLTLFLGLVGGLGVGIGLAFFVNFLDDSIKSQDDIEVYLKLPFLGYIPNIQTKSVIERDLQSHLAPQSNSAEAFRTIRAAISLSQRSDHLQALAVTSTVPSEGKSLVASNYAVVTAQTGAKTLLVDMDLRRPSVHKAFQLQSPIGVSSYLMGKVESVDEIVHQTEVPNLDVICCGAVPHNPSELAGSQRMRDFVKAIRERYSRILFDCPPVSAVSDPLIIASATDGVLFVSKFNKVRREHARKTIQRVQDAGIHIVGITINDLDFEGKDSYYYSYYYYQNRYYASHYKTDGDGKAKGDKPRKGKQEEAKV